MDKFDFRGSKMIEGMDILEVVPEEVIPQMEIGASDYGMDLMAIVQDCTLYIDQRNDCSHMYKVGEWVFSGALLLTFNLYPKCGHGVGFPKKRFYLHLYKANNHYCH